MTQLGAAATTLNDDLALGSDVNTFFKTKLRMKGFTRFLSDTQTNHYGDDYSTGSGGWKHQWIPPCGSPPIPVRSAFGGLTIYRTAQYLSGKYDGADCEHVTFHKSIADHYGDGLYLNPSQRSIMHLMGD
jgi:hypothetical protein